MKKLTLALALSAAATFANGPISAQTFQNGPYYANPSWDQQIPAGQRFIVLSNWNNDAVLDRETGLVWQRDPALFSSPNEWTRVLSECRNVSTGNRLGWRLPSEEELASLIDPTQSSPALPAGNPFQDIQVGAGDLYWTASTYELDAGAGYVVNFSQGVLNIAPKGNAEFAWCVRGGSGAQNPQ
jgi:hypothetical protein